MNETRIDVEATMLYQPEAKDYLITVTGGPDGLVGLFAFGVSQANARRALFDLIALAVAGENSLKPAPGPDTVIRIIIPEAYDRPLGAMAAA